jgi:hypothetical protein
MTIKRSAIVVALLFALGVAVVGSPLGAATVNVYPNATAYHTGSVNGNSGTPVPLYSTTMFFQGGADNNQKRAWARFNTSPVPPGSTVDSLRFYMNVQTSSNPNIHLMQMAADPTTATWAALYADIADGAQYFDTTALGPGWNSCLLPAQAITDFTSQLTAEWFAIGIHEYHATAGNFAQASGWDNDDSMPYIAVFYTPLPPPVAPAPVSPDNGDTVAFLRPELEVGDLSGATKYHFRIFLSGVKAAEESVATFTWTPATNLMNESTYTWDCRARNIAGWGDYFTPAWSFTIHYVPPDTFWTAKASVPLGGKGKNVKDGACAAYQEKADSGFIYLLKGNNTAEFYRYNTAANVWTSKESIPVIGRSGKKKKVKKGATMAAASSKLYAAKGNNTLEFWEYNPAATDAYKWTQKADVPTGIKNVKEGAGAVGYTIGDTCYVYFLKGSGTQEFYRFNLLTNTWASKASAPAGLSGKPFKKGSGITDPNDGLLYVLKGSYNEFFSYNVDSNRWFTMTSLPLVNRLLKKKKAGDGAGLAYHDGIVYALKGGNTQEFWSYWVDSNRWTQRTDIPLAGGKRVKGGGTLVFAAKADALYATAGNNKLDFFKYGLWGFVPTELSSGAMENASFRTPSATFRIAPNPFTGRATVSYSLSRAGKLSLKLYDVTGALVTTLRTGFAAAGNYTANLDATRLSHGIYLMRLETENESTTQKLILE